MSVVLGTMNIAYAHSSNHDDEEYTNIIEQYTKDVSQPILDSAYYYGDTKTEYILGNIFSKNGLYPYVTTKANPWYENDFTTGKLGQLNSENLRRQLAVSLKNLQVEKVHRFFLHCPDYETPIKETLETCNDLWRLEKFEEWGLSNFSLQQTKEVLEICDDNSFRKPVVYQGMYNMICRRAEELFPLLQDNNIEFWAYNPLAGGLLSGKYKNRDFNHDSRFKNNTIYQSIFWKPEMLDLVDEITADPLQCAFQFYYQGSLMKPGDKIILGVSTTKQYSQNMSAIQNCHIDFNWKSFESLYRTIEPATPNYFY